jgi:peptidoglycan/LPS O-acetylase OafA/YrhL
VVPITALVVAATALGAIALMPDTDWARQIRHAFTSLAFVENWQLIRTGADYLQQGLAASPFQQMWALSLQVQVYAAFPLVYAAASFTGRGAAWLGPRRCAALCFALILIVSLAYSIHATQADQPAAYFNSFTRLWEFAAGSLLALVIDRIRLPRMVASLAGWAGLVLLLGLGLVVDVSSAFPGYLAALPVLAALAVIVAAANGGQVYPLRARPVVAMADMSFAFYQWHWPLLILLRYRLQTDEVGAWGLLVVVGAGMLAYASTRWAEMPFRRWPYLERHAVVSLGASALVLLFASLAPLAWKGVHSSEVATARQRLAAFMADPGATPIAPGETIPATVLALEDILRACNQGQYASVTPATCLYGDTSAAATVILVGGSHSLQWLPALDLLGKERGFKVMNMTRDACVFIVGPFGNSSCPVWNENAMALIVELQPELVVTIGTRWGTEDGRFTETVPAGYEAAWRQLESHAIPVLAIRDNPWFPNDVVNCVAAAKPDWSRCNRPRAELLADELPRPVASLSNVTFADFSDLLCDERECWIVRDGVLIYRDSNHLTQAFAALHADRMGEAVAQALSLHHGTALSAGLPTAQD